MIATVPVHCFSITFGNLGFSIGKSETVGFSETIASCDLKVGRCRQLIEFMKVLKVMSFLDLGPRSFISPVAPISLD